MLADRRWRWVVVVACLGLGVHVVQRSLEGSHDFDGFHAAARHLLDTGTLSTEKAVTRYPPTFQVLHVPLALLPVGWAAGLWYVLSLAALFDLPRRLHALSGVLPADQRVAWWIMLPFIIDNLMLGQSAPLLLWLTTVSLVALRTGRAFGRGQGGGVSGGLGLGLATAFKVLPVLQLAVPLVMGRARPALLGTLLALAATGALVVVATDSEQALASTTRWATLTRAEQTPWSLVANNRSLRYNNQGLGVTLARTFTDISPAKAKGRVELASWPRQWAWITLGVLGLILGVVGLAALRAAGRRGTPEAWLAGFALASLAGLFLSPIVWTHYFLWMLPGLVAIRRRARLVAGGVVLVVALAIQPLRGLGLHMLASVGLYLVIAWDLLRPAERASVGADLSASWEP